MPVRNSPLPGRRVRGSSSGRPVMAALDLLGRRWALRILWELRRGGLGFRALQRACDDMSSSVLRDRLAELGEARLVTAGADETYMLTALGAELGEALAPLTEWSNRWAGALVSSRRRRSAGRADHSGRADRTRRG